MKFNAWFRLFLIFVMPFELPNKEIDEGINKTNDIFLVGRSASWRLVEVVF